MTEHHVINPLSTGVDYPALAARFRPIFQRIADGAVEREQTRALPHEPIQWLKEAGFGAVRVPVEYGGGGASLPQLFELLIELAEADSNVPPGPARALCLCRRPPECATKRRSRPVVQAFR